MAPSASGDQKIKQPNVSGQFYDANPTRLTREIEKYLKQADVTPYDKHIDVIIAPHAGYMYSGQVAAYSFKSIQQKQYKTIIILAPSHYYPFDGISIWEEGGFQTPLGTASVDADLAKQLIDADEKFYYYPQAFEQEHSLEVEIPFLQRTFKDFQIVPVIMGQPTFSTLQKFAKALHNAIGDREDVLIVVSTDMSHYHDDASARAIDKRTIDAIKKLGVEEIWKGNQSRTMEMCGYVPVTAALLYAQIKGLTNVDLLKYANSGDVSGDKERVVGYTAFAIYKGQKQGNSEPPASSSLDLKQKRKLIEIAKTTIHEYVKTGRIIKFHETDPRLLEKEGTFVTIHKHGRLRGCMGHIIADGPLCYLVRDIAITSATRDPRFPPLKSQELNEIEIEVSVLSVPRVIKDVNEIQMGVHGVIISRDPYHSGVFLPQVATETGWSKNEFLAQLCSQKAGLPADCWKDPKTKIEIFTADVFSEKDVQ